MKWFLIAFWFLGFLMIDFHGRSKAEALIARLIWPLSLCYSVKAWWHGKAKMYLFLDKTDDEGDE